MIKKCLFCGEEFIAKCSYHVYCSVECRNHIRWKHTRDEQRQKITEDKKKAVELYSSTLSTQEIAGMLNRQPNFIYDAWHDAGLGKRPTEFQRNVAELRRKGLCSVEISEVLGKPANQIAHTAKRLGMPFTPEEIARSIELGRKKCVNQYGDMSAQAARAAKFIQENKPGFSYVSGNIGGDGMMRLRCECCGTVVEKYAVTVRHPGKLVCYVCAERRAEEALKERERERERQRIEAFWSQDFKQNEIGWKVCPECGTIHTDKRRKYCSEKCKRKAENRRRWHKKDKRLKKDNIVDRDIDLKKLYARDHGICWICGNKCDFDDHWTDENGAYYVGASYPSIDHVMPLSKGGLHSWDNVKLAHHYCNTLKNNKVVGL